MICWSCLLVPAPAPADASHHRGTNEALQGGLARTRNRTFFHCFQYHLVLISYICITGNVLFMELKHLITGNVCQVHWLHLIPGLEIFSPCNMRQLLFGPSHLSVFELKYMAHLGESVPTFKIRVLRGHRSVWPNCFERVCALPPLEPTSSCSEAIVCSFHLTDRWETSSVKGFHWPWRRGLEAVSLFYIVYCPAMSLFYSQPLQA